MKVLDLFSGLGGFSQAFLERGHEVITLDNEPKFQPTILADILHVEYYDLPKVDVILASPPCDCFSYAAASWEQHWTWHHTSRFYTARTSRAEVALSLVEKTLSLIEEIHPRFWIMENPRGFLRETELMIGRKKVDITQCMYDAPWPKPTNLWGEFPPSFVPRPFCKTPEHHNAKRDARGIPSAKKSGAMSVLARNPAVRAKLPYELSLDLCLACESDL